MRVVNMCIYIRELPHIPADSLTVHLLDLPLQRILEEVCERLESALVVLLPLLHLTHILIAEGQPLFRHALESAK